MPAPTLPNAVEGPPVERVLLRCYEMANLAWAVEELAASDPDVVADRHQHWMATAPEPEPAGPEAVHHSYSDERREMVERRDAWLKVALVPLPPGELPRQGVWADIPTCWFPLVPEPIQPDAIQFRLVELTGDEPAPEPVGRSLAKWLWVHKEKVRAIRRRCSAVRCWPTGSSARRTRGAAGEEPGLGGVLQRIGLRHGISHTTLAFLVVHHAKSKQPLEPKEPPCRP